MKQGKFRLLELGPNLIGALFGAPLLLVFVSQTVSFTPEATRLLPWVAGAIVALMVIGARLLNRRSMGTLARFFFEGDNGEEAASAAMTVALRMPLRRSLQLLVEFLVGGPLVVLVLVAFDHGTGAALIVEILLPCLISGVVAGALAFLAVEHLLHPYISLLALSLDLKAEVLAAKAQRIGITWRLMALFFIVMTLSLVFGLTLARYPGIWYVALLGVAATGVIGYLTARNINRTLRSLTGILENISAGKGGITQHLPVLANDELGDMCVQYNHFVAKIHRMLQELAKVASELAGSSQELAASSQQMNASTQEISSTIQQISRGASVQSERLTQVVKEVENLSTAIKRIDSQGRMTMVSSQKAIESSQVGASKTSETVQRMSEIFSAMEETTRQVQELQTRAKHIGQVVDMISGISQQTDFLALNAAIEAARAGEAGKGFSVVADEIRTLAVEAGKSAQQVTDLIREVEKEIYKTVDEIARARSIIESSRGTVDETEQALRVINSTVAVAGTMVKQIADSGHSQNTSVGHVVQLASEVSTVAIEAAASTEEVAAAVQQQTASMEELSAVAQTLSETADKLNNLVVEFGV
jgi:methyl-accepting chemotaxis protein